MSDVIETADQKIERLLKVVEEKRKFQYEIGGRYSTRRSQLEAQYNKIISGIMVAEFGTTVQDSQQAANDADRAWRRAMDEKRIAEANAKLPFPEGTILVKWEAPRWNAQSPWTKSQERGIFQMFKEGDEYPSNIKWARWAPGDFVVRLLKKDGSAGLKIERYGESCGYKWLPEGQDLYANKA